MRRALSIALMAIFICGFVFTTIQAEPNVDQNRVALMGFDPVSYHQENPTKGSKSLTVEYKGVVYHFHNDKNRTLFRNDPETYIPAYGGWCAWAMLDGEKVDINPQRYKLIGGRTYLFYDRFFINTLNKWNQAAENTSEAQLLEKAAHHWLKLTDGSL